MKIKISLLIAALFLLSPASSFASAEYADKATKEAAELVTE